MTAPTLPRSAGTAPPTAPPRPSRAARARRWVDQQGFWFLLMAPVLGYLLVAQAYPLLQTVQLSLYDYQPTLSAESTFVGIDNYVALITSDRNFWQIVRNSLVWVIGAGVLQMVLGTLAALALNAKLRARALLRGLLMIPWVTPVVVVAIVWRWIFDGQHGLVNHYLEAVGAIDAGIVWLGSDVWVWPVLLLASTWKGMPFVTLMVLAGLQGVPQELLESADVDGASRWQRLTRVTLPQLRPMLFVTGMITLVTSWFKFELIWALTNGGPGFATSILPTYVYTQAFQRFDFGMAGTVATTAMVIVLVLAFAYNRLVNGREGAAA